MWQRLRSCCERLARREFLRASAGQQPSGPMGQSRHAIGFCMRSTRKCCTSRVTRGGGLSAAPSALASGKSERMASARTRLPRNWRCILNEGEITAKRCSICITREKMPLDGARIREAINLLTKGVELLKTLPDTSERTQQELALQITLGIPWQATRGFASPEVERPIPEPGSCASRSGKLPNSSLSSRATMFLSGAGRSYRRRVSWGSSSASGPDGSKTRPSLWRLTWAVGSTLFYLGELVAAQSAPGAGLDPL